MSMLLSIRGLCVDIPGPAGTLHALRDIDFDLIEGEVHALVGESGCGKSLTAMAVIGLLPKRAQVAAKVMDWGDEDMRAFTHRRWSRLRGPEIATIFQDPMTALNPILTVGEQMTESFLAHGLGTKREARARAEHLLDRVGVSPAPARMAQFPHEMSGGLRQRVMIAQALMCRPRLIIADEPTTALDVTTQVEILSLLKELQRESGVSMILISHDFGVVSHIADRVTVMYAGALAETGTVGRVVRHPAHPYTRALLDCLPVRGDAGRPLTPIPGVVPPLTGDLSGCVFRNRCAYARPACAGNIPVTEPVAGQIVRCVLAHDAFDPAAPGPLPHATEVTP